MNGMAIFIIISLTGSESIITKCKRRMPLIEKLLPVGNGEKRQTNLPGGWRNSPDERLRREITARVRGWHGSAENFLARYHPEVQTAAAAYPDRAFAGRSPTLAELRVAYSSGLLEAWLIQQLSAVAAFTGVSKPDDFQVLECARMVAEEFYYLKASELLLFFARFKAGRYGRFYGSFDPLVVTAALHGEFLRDRAAELSRLEREARERAERERPRERVCTREEYEELLRRAAAGDEEARVALRRPDGR